MTQAYLYALVDPRDDEVRYIGISINPAERFRGHINEAKKDTKTAKRRWIRSLMNQGMLPTFSVIQSGVLTWAQLGQLEIDNIAAFRADGHDLTNMTAGGDGVRDFFTVRTPQWNQNLSQAIAMHMASLSQEQKKARSSKRVSTIRANNNGTYPGHSKGRTSPMKGRTMSEESKQKMRDSQKARWEKIKAEGRYEEVCANIAAGTKRAMNGDSL